MRALRFFLALGVAAVLQFVGMQLFPWFTLAVDFFLVIAVFNAMDGSTLAGMLGGCLAGLLTDALTGGPFGLYGFANTVVGYGTDEFPAFYARQSGLPVDVRVDTPREAAAIVRAGRQLGLRGGTLITVPVPAAHELPAEHLEAAVAAALSEAQAEGVEGSALTPFLLDRVAEQTGGTSIKANVALLENNAAVAVQIAMALKELS